MKTRTIVIGGAIAAGVVVLARLDRQNNERNEEIRVLRERYPHAAISSPLSLPTFIWGKLAGIISGDRDAMSVKHNGFTG